MKTKKIKVVFEVEAPEDLADSRILELIDKGLNIAYADASGCDDIYNDEAEYFLKLDIGTLEVLE